MKRLAVTLAAATAAVSMGFESLALERTWTQYDNRCLFWYERSLPIFLNDRGSRDVPLPQLEQALQGAATAWTAPECSDIELRYEGKTQQSFVGYDAENPDINQNIVVFVGENWQRDAKHTQATIALTSVTYDPCSGEMLDADIEFNEEFLSFNDALVTSPCKDYDVQNVLTHELGHLIGFDESQEPESSMYYQAGTCETSKRDLTSGDVKGLCETYPVEAPTPDCPNSVPCGETVILGECECALIGQAPQWSLLASLLRVL